MEAPDQKNLKCDIAAVELSSSVFWIITRREVVLTDVSEIPIGPIFKSNLTLEEQTNR
jgi:hypothetical protein